MIETLATYHIHIAGLVQGVGFRPFVWQLANAYQLKGWVNNTIDGVHIEINATTSTAEKFNAALIQEAPELAVIQKHSMSIVSNKVFSEFSIVESAATGEASLMLTPDYALCNHCKSEFHDSTNRRYHYPFITCTYCGPRYSIIHQLPYDRVNTAMENFPMCPECTTEYN
ncbi:MAG: acylphosphatase, partial [Ferruginibacter sp.]